MLHFIGVCQGDSGLVVKEGLVRGDSGKNSCVVPVTPDGNGNRLVSEMKRRYYIWKILQTWGRHKPSLGISGLWGHQREDCSSRHLADFPEAFILRWEPSFLPSGSFQKTAEHGSNTIRPAVQVSHHPGTAVSHNVWSSDSTRAARLDKDGLLRKQREVRIRRHRKCRNQFMLLVILRQLK